MTHYCVSNPCPICYPQQRVQVGKPHELEPFAHYVGADMLRDEIVQLRTLNAELTRQLSEANERLARDKQIIADNAAANLELRRELSEAREAGERDRREGIYVASRVKHAVMWLNYRAEGVPINSTWIDEAGEGETGDFSELWHRIESEIRRSAALVLYVLSDDFPLKGALIECGMAMAAGVPIYVYTDAELEGRTMRPLGSWILDSRVHRMPSIDAAIAAAKKEG